VVNGPLIPGMREFDTPRRGAPAWLPWLIGAVVVVGVLVVVAGFVGGVGPLRFLGLTTSGLQSVPHDDGRHGPAGGGRHAAHRPVP